MNTQEQLTEDEREAVRRGTCQASGPKALRIIDAQAAALTAANARADAAEVQAHEAELTLDEVQRKLDTVHSGHIACKQAWVAKEAEFESEAAALRATVERLRGSKTRVREAQLASRLAATNARIAELEAALDRVRAVLKTDARHIDQMTMLHFYEALAGVPAPEAIDAETQAALQRNADYVATGLPAALTAANARADAAERARGQALAICEEREQMLKAVESEAAALRAEVERLRHEVAIAWDDSVETGRANAAKSEAERLRSLWHGSFRAWRRAENENNELRAGVEMLRALVKTCTEAEQAVLDAMAAIPDEDLEWTIELHADAPSTPVVEACRAELARRGLKP